MEKTLVPSLLSGSGAWIGNIENAVKLCNQLQYFYWRKILNVPTSCPKIALQSETNMLDMKLRIPKNKCLLLKKIKNMDESVLAKEIYLKTKENDQPGLGNEVKQICEYLGIPDLNEHDVQKREILEKIKKKNSQEIYEELNKSSKMGNIQYMNFNKPQEYFNDKNIENARLKFRFRTKMLNNIPGNFKDKFMYDQSKLLCEYCPTELSQDHFIICSGRKIHRQGLDLGNLDDVVTYIRRTIGTG